MIFIIPQNKNLLRLKNYFDNYLKTNWNWLFKFPHNYDVDINLTFNMNIDKFIHCYIKCIPVVDVNKELEKLASYFKIWY